MILHSKLPIDHLIHLPTGLTSCTSCYSVLLKSLSFLIEHMSKALILLDCSPCFMVADSGATDHMFSKKLAFLLYKLVGNLQVRMGNNSYFPVLGQIFAVISLDGQRILVQNMLHILGLVVPLYSHHAHFTQPGYGFIGTNGIGILVYFPAFVLLVNTSKDCHLAYKSLERSVPLETIHYIQPCFAPSLYPSEIASHLAAKSQAYIEDDSSRLGDSDAIILSYPQPKCISPTRLPSPMSVAAPPSTGAPSADLESVLAQLFSLVDAVSAFTTLVSPTSPTNNATTHGSHSFPILASTMIRDEIILLLHHNILSLLSVCPCNTANATDTKTHWATKELHCIMGCHKF
jgi:hypothetical protein